MNKWIRQFHRWTSLAFTGGALINTIVIVMAGGAQPDFWVYLLALIPLALLLLTGTYLFVLPYTAKRDQARVGA